MKHWYHIDCLLDSFKTQRATTKTIETIDDISGWETIGDLDKDLIMEKLEQLPKFNKNSGASIAAGTSNNVVRNCLCLCLYFGFQFFFFIFFFCILTDILLGGWWFFIFSLFFFLSLN